MRVSHEALWWGGVLDPEETVAGEKWLLESSVRVVVALSFLPLLLEMTPAGYFFNPDSRPLPYNERAVTLPIPPIPQAAFPWTPNSARAWKKAETSSKSFPRALPSLLWLTSPSRSWMVCRSGAPEEAVGAGLLPAEPLAWPHHRQPVPAGKGDAEAV